MSESTAARKFWAGAGFIAVASLIYAIRGLPSGYDMVWHGGMFLLGLGLMLPFRHWSMAMAVLRDVFGKSRVAGISTPPKDGE